MTDAHGDENAKEEHDAVVRRARPPSKKRLEDEVDAVMAEIREKETQLKTVTVKNEDFRSIRAEKDAIIERRKKVDADLKVLNQAITQKMAALSKLQSSLRYTTEEKHNDAIRKLEWNLKVQNFKLSQEKKIVAEIDSLKRSKKLLGQYLAMRKEIDETRDKQRRMREERDHYFKAVTQLKAKEETNRRINFANKNRAEVLKKEINELYEKKRGLVSEFRKQKEVFTDQIKRQRAESFRRKEEERRAQLEEEKKEIEELELQTDPYESERTLCNTLISYLQKLCPGEDFPDTCTSTSVEDVSSVDSLALENEDGYRLLRKSDDLEEFPALSRRSNKNRRRSRKISTTRPVTHTPHVISQFSSLNLNAPTSLSEIKASLEQLQGRKLFYEQKAKEEQDLNLEGADMSDRRDRLVATWGFLGEKQPILEELSQSEAGVSGTESMVCEMSRQASKTESCESATDARPSDMLMEELLKTCCEGSCGEQTKPAFQDIDSHSLSDSSDTPRSESTLEGSNGESLGSGNDFAVRLEAGRQDAQSHSISSEAPSALNCDKEISSGASCDRTLDISTVPVPCDTPTRTENTMSDKSHDQPKKKAPSICDQNVHE